MPSSVGERIRHRRTELGLTQVCLSQKAGISKSFLSDVENGKRSIGAETLYDLGRTMALSLDYLMSGEGEESQRQAQIPIDLSTFAAEEGLSVRDTITLLRLQEQILTGRKGVEKQNVEFNWKEFYDAVKKFL
jgi:transcriptional regulator with XRE-family HTH domain